MRANPVADESLLHRVGQAGQQPRLQRASGVHFLAAGDAADFLRAVPAAGALFDSLRRQGEETCLADTQEKQQDQLVEKLIQRLPLTTDVYKWRCLFYCLNCLPVTSLTLSKYLQNKRPLKDALRNREVKESMMQIVAKVAAAEMVKGS